MHYTLEVCLLALTLTPSTVPLLVAQSEARTHPPLQKGISVELPVTSNAVPLPDADQENALIVTVTDEGSVYVGIGLTTTAALAERVKGGLSNRTEKKVYIKADARTPYASVARVLEALRTAGVEAPNLLTAQTGSSEPGTLVSPKGLEVSLGPRLASGSEAVVLQVAKSGQRLPRLKVNDEPVPWEALQTTLRLLFQNRRDRVVLLKAEGTLPFADVVKAADMCRSTGTEVVLVTPPQ
jgi:biopolymer transport protein TolR